VRATAEERDDEGGRAGPITVVVKIPTAAAAVSVLGAVPRSVLVVRSASMLRRTRAAAWREVAITLALTVCARGLRLALVEARGERSKRASAVGQENGVIKAIQ